MFTFVTVPVSGSEITSDHYVSFECSIDVFIWCCVEISKHLIGLLVIIVQCSLMEIKLGYFDLFLVIMMREIAIVYA